jgi:hypothetical protein
MRGSRAKKLRRLAYNPIAYQYSRNREYMVVKAPGQWQGAPGTVIADEMRYLYQTLKERRPYAPS